MKKALFFCACCLILACADRSAENPDNSGAINHISLIIEDELWNGEVGDSIRNKLASPVVGLPDEEPLFTINQYPLRLLEGFMSDSRTVLVVKKKPGKNFKIIRNDPARRQQVVHISGNTVAEIVRTLEQKSPSLIQLMRDAEFEEMQKRIDSERVNPAILRNQFQIDIGMTPQYRIAYKAPNFVWFKKDIISGNLNLLVYQIPMRNDRHGLNILKLRDSIGAAHIHGTAADSDMVTENAFAPYVSQLTIGGKKVIETRGTWELKNDFMSGPFINFAFFDTEKRRILILEGFCYAPSRQKRDLLFELETLMRSIEFTK